MTESPSAARSPQSSPAPSYTTAVTVEDFRRNLDAVRARIDAAAKRAGRDATEIRLLPVSKTVPEERLRAAFADEFQALDSLRLAEALDRRLQAAGRGLDVYVQVNSSGEPSKFGLEPDDVADFLAALPAYSSLRVRGLMTLAANTSDEARVRECFGIMRRLRDAALQAGTVGDGLLSMGMSGDFEAAIEGGSTCVRVGQAIFGTRATPDSYYWPESSQADQPRASS